MKLTTKIKKNPISIRLIRDGEILKKNTFDTMRGKYDIYAIQYHENIYFVKVLNGNVVEAVNLSKECCK